jgi:predicted esterase
MKAMTVLNRRDFLVRASATSVLAFSGCSWADITGSSDNSAKLTARPRTPQTSLGPGTHIIDFGDPRIGRLFVPQSVDPQRATPLLVALHGAGGTGAGPINLLGSLAEERGFYILAPDSRAVTWDAIRGGFGSDVAFIDRALDYTFGSCLVDPQRIYLEGFSDGASYALGLGPANPELFKRVIGFSAGFISRSGHPVNGIPEIFLSHGRQDSVLPFAYAQQVIAPTLYSEGFAVTFVEFEGDHGVPPEIARQAIDWMLSPLTPRP